MYVEQFYNTYISLTFIGGRSGQLHIQSVFILVHNYTFRKYELCLNVVSFKINKENTVRGQLTFAFMQ